MCELRLRFIDHLCVHNLMLLLNFSVLHHFLVEVGWWSSGITALGDIRRSPGVERECNDMLDARRRLLSARIALSVHVDNLFRSRLKVLTDSIAVDVSVLHLVLLVESDLAFEEHFAEVHHLQHIRDFEILFEQAVPGLEHLADLSDFRLSSLSTKLVLLLIHLELQLESEEYCAGSQHVRLILHQAGVKGERLANVVRDRLDIEKEFTRVARAVDPCL